MDRQKYPYRLPTWDSYLTGPRSCRLRNATGNTEPEVVLTPGRFRSNGTKSLRKIRLICRIPTCYRTLLKTTQDAMFADMSAIAPPATPLSNSTCTNRSLRNRSAASASAASACTPPSLSRAVRRRSLSLRLGPASSPTAASDRHQGYRWLRNPSKDGAGERRAFCRLQICSNQLNQT